MYSRSKEDLILQLSSLFKKQILENRSGNVESTAKDFHLLASIFNQKMIISGYTEYAFSLYKYTL